MKRVALFILLTSILLLSSILRGAEDGENKFSLRWSSTRTDFPYGIPYTLWDCIVLPDFNNDGRDELFIAADDPISGAWYFVVQASADDVYAVIWYTRIRDCLFSYVVNYSPASQDIDGDGLPELIAGVAQDRDSGRPGLYIWEKDTTIVDPIPGASIVFPFSPVPTLAYDVQGRGSSVTCVFTAQLDDDVNTELVIGEQNEPMLRVLEELRGDLSYPNFHVEFTDTLRFDPWGYFRGDIDQDGYPDFGIGTSDFNGIRIYENTGLADDYLKHFEIHLDYDVDGYCLRGLDIVDINDDGLYEIIFVRHTHPGKVYLMTNPGEIGDLDLNDVHTIYVNPDGLSCSGVAIGDMDHGFTRDGKDIYFIASSSQVIDLEFTGMVNDVQSIGNPDDWMTYMIYTDPTQSMQKLCAADFDMDGEGELAIIYRGAEDRRYLEILEHEPLPDANFNIMWHDHPDTIFHMDPVNSNPRGICAGSDVDQDGKPEILCTEYDGKFHVYEVVADNTVEWVFSYKNPHAPADGSQPRDITVGDVDGNGLQEIICHMGGSNLSGNPDSLGFYFFEWDGFRDNGYGYAGRPTCILPARSIDPRLTSTERTESIWVEDVDQDGDQEILWPCDAADENGDGFYIFSCIDGELSGNPLWYIELSQHRASGEMTGSPKGAKTSDCDGDGRREAIFTSWNQGQVSFFEALGPDAYEETTVYIDPYQRDQVIYKGIGVCDIDLDGADEIFFNLYNNGLLLLLNPPSDLRNMDVHDPNQLSILRERTGATGLTGEVGDQDQDGLPEFYYPLYSRGAVRMIEYIGAGADMLDPGSYMTQQVFSDRDFHFGEHFEQGVLTRVHGSFGIVVPQRDLDGDGRKELIVSMIQSSYSNTWLYVFEYAGPTGFQAESWRIITPADYRLSQNYPNPFNANTKIDFYLPLDKRVTLVIYDILGRKVRTLLKDVVRIAGHHSVVWDGTNDGGFGVASGSYTYRLEVGNTKLSRRLSLMK